MAGDTPAGLVAHRPVGPVLRSDAQSGVPGFWASVSEPACQSVGRYAVCRRQPRYTSGTVQVVMNGIGGACREP